MTALAAADLTEEGERLTWARRVLPFAPNVTPRRGGAPATFCGVGCRCRPRYCSGNGMTLSGGALGIPWVFAGITTFGGTGFFLPCTSNPENCPGGLGGCCFTAELTCGFRWDCFCIILEALVSGWGAAWLGNRRAGEPFWRFGFMGVGL